MRLDNKLLKEFNIENYKSIFTELVEAKTDKYDGLVKLPMGVDGNNFCNIKKNIKQFAVSFCNRATKGNYIFSPFREIQIPKAPYSKFEYKTAKAEGKLRTLAICTINDTIFQKMIYNSIYDYTEKKYKNISDSIFSYRKGKSVKQAIEKIQEYFQDGYLYGLDGDIEKYFDKINHNRLYNKIQRFYKNDPLVIKYLYRFMHSSRVPVENRKGVAEYHTKKPIVEKRLEGIPQGGVLSGLLANLYLFNFDNYVINNLRKKYDIQYIRYADGFIMLCKDKNIIPLLYKKIKSYFLKEKLNLHPIDYSAIDGSKPNTNKTKAINLEVQHYIEFLGYRISLQYLGVKKDNIKKFKKNILHIIKQGLKEKLHFDKIYYKINAKILGNWIYSPGYFTPCNKCGKPQKPQSWIGFFINITDMRQLKYLDRWIRGQIYHFFFVRYKTRLPKKYFRKKIACNYKSFLNMNLISLFKEACYIKQYFTQHPNVKYCECDSYSPIELSYS